MSVRGVVPGQAGSGALVRLFHVSKSYLAGSWALRDVSLELTKGEFVFLTGPSGAGKTTLMRMIFADEQPSEGQIIVLGRNVSRLGPAAIPALRRRIGVVFQDFKLLPRRTVEENVGLALDVVGTPDRERRARVFAMLKRVGLQHRRHHHPLGLSGGEQQRLAIARASAGAPEVLLLDEPTANLDPAAARGVEALVREVCAGGTRVILATHDLAQARRLADRVVFLHRGRCLEHAPAQAFFEKPESAEAQAFLAGELIA